MKYFLFNFIFIASFILLNGCKFNQNSEQLIKENLSIERCKTDTNHFYTLYVPSHEAKCNEMPVVIIIDPHGSGDYAIKKFIETAEKQKCILVASHFIKNNYAQYLNAIQQLIEDTKNLTSPKSSIYICGFSGGARMAITYSQLFPVNGVLACGALTSVEQLNENKTTIYSIMGMSDFNFAEISEFIINPISKPKNLYLEISGELHEWPSNSTISRGLCFLMNSSNNTKTCLSKKTLQKVFETSTKEIIDSLILAKEYIKAQLICSNILRLSKLQQLKIFQNLYNSINESIVFKNETKCLKKSLQFEMKVREAYYNAFLSAETNWWVKELKALNHQILIEKDRYNLYAFKRIKAYLGILCYSMANNSLYNNDLPLSLKVLNIYKIVEPDNADMLFFSALYNFKIGNIKESKIFIKKAVIAGFSDTNLIRQNFPSIIYNNTY